MGYFYCKTTGSTILIDKMLLLILFMSRLALFLPHFSSFQFALCWLHLVREFGCFEKMVPPFFS